MKQPTVSVRPALGAVVGVEVALIAAFVALPPGRVTWWPFAAVAALAAVSLLVSVHRRNAAAMMALAALDHSNLWDSYWELQKRVAA